MCARILPRIEPAGYRSLGTISPETQPVYDIKTLRVLTGMDNLGIREKRLVQVCGGQFKASEDGGEGSTHPILEDLENN